MSDETESHIPTTITRETIEQAQTRIAPYIHRTPVFTSEFLSNRTNIRLFLKAENLQKTGSFKVRGATNAIAQLTPEQRALGVVTFSSGNHGQGLAYAAQQFGVPCTVFITEHAVPSKLAAIRGYGATIREFPTVPQALEALRQTSEQTGAIWIASFVDEAVITGQATIGLELVEQIDEFEQVIVPIGGGGLISGIALALRLLRPEVRIVGVEPEKAPTLTRALAAGHPVDLDSVDTLADGLAATYTGDVNLAIIRNLVDDVVVVTEDEIVDALKLVLDRTKLLIEPASAAGIAALLTGKAGVDPGASTVAILSGGNIDLAGLKQLL